jgi:hypothetical protein
MIECINTRGKRDNSRGIEIFLGVTPLGMCFEDVLDFVTCFQRAENGKGR